MVELARGIAKPRDHRFYLLKCVPDPKASALALIPKKSVTTTERNAERRAAEENVFLREVDDALRTDNTLHLLRRYGMIVGGVIVLVLAALAGWMLWTNHVAHVAGVKGENFAIALDQVEAGRYDPARASLDQLTANGGPGYAASARLVEGGIALDQKKPQDAAKIFAAIAADPKAPQPYRDLATVREMAIRFDQVPPQTVIDRLKPLAVPGNPWFGSAGELVGVAEIKAGHKPEAGALFAQMSKDPSVPESLRRRASQLATELGVDPGDAVTVVSPALAE